MQVTPNTIVIKHQKYTVFNHFKLPIIPKDNLPKIQRNKTDNMRDALLLLIPQVEVMSGRKLAKNWISKGKQYSQKENETENCS